MPSSPALAPNAWRVLFLLFLANLFNFFDRTIPSIINEPLRLEWNLSDTQIGLIGTVFTLVYAIAGVPLGRMADTGSRAKIMGWGLAAWSGLTAVNGMVGNFWSFLLVRMGVGIGEASYGPAANALIGDLFPAHARARAIGIFMLGLPLGLLLAFFSIGYMVKAFDSWRVPFFIAAIPGLLLAVLMFCIREPARGAADGGPASATQPVSQPLRNVLRIRTFWWLMLAGLAFNFATYATSAFMVSLSMRYFGQDIGQAAVGTGIIVGLTAGGWVADRLHQRYARGRLLFGALSMLLAALCTGVALALGRLDYSLFVALFGLGWLFSYNVYTCCYSALQDVVEPRLRATAMALFFCWAAASVRWWSGCSPTITPKPQCSPPAPGR